MPVLDLLARAKDLDLLARAKDGEGVKSGPLGLAVILVLCVAMYFLFKSMSKHLKRVREEFPVDRPARAEGGTSPGGDEPSVRAASPPSTAAPPTTGSPPTPDSP